MSIDSFFSRNFSRFCSMWSTTAARRSCCWDASISSVRHAFHDGTHASWSSSGLDVSSLLCSNDRFFGGLGACADGVSVQVSATLRTVLGEAFDLWHKVLPWYQECRPCGRFVLHLLEFFSIQLFPSDIRIRHLWLKTAIEVEEIESGGTIKATKVGRRILQKYQNDLNLWTAYAALLFEHGHVKVSPSVTFIDPMGLDAGVVSRLEGSTRQCRSRRRLRSVLLSSEHGLSIPGRNGAIHNAVGSHCISGHTRCSLSSALSPGKGQDSSLVSRSAR